jgi:hypothetical protein
MDRDELTTAETLDIAQYATHGFCGDYPLARHRHEALANAGCQEARRDWARYIGRAGEFGGCNPATAISLLWFCRCVSRGG